MNGGDYDDELYGEEGNDTLDGGSNNDLLIGGTGNDTYIAHDDEQESVTGEDSITVDPRTIKEYLNEGTDTVQYFGSSERLGDNLENLILTDSSGITTGEGNALDNRIDGNAGVNLLVGGDGNDYLLAYDNYDILVGEAGNDTLDGGAGDDFLNGGSGSDTLTGGAGADKFVFSSPFDGIDSITDFTYLEGDKIEVSASGFGIGQGQYDRFIFDSSTNALFFDQTQVAFLQPGSVFVPSLDISIV